MRTSYLIIFCFVAALIANGQTQTDAAGKKQGYWKKRDDKGKLLFEGLFKDNTPQGMFKYYYPFDSVKATMNFSQNGNLAYSTMFHPSGKKMAYGKYIKEQKDSVWTYFDDKGALISREAYLTGKKNGKEIVYFPDGVMSEERNYKMGIQDGLFKLYFDKQTVKGEGNYVNGIMEGKNAYYYPNGVAAATGYYKNGNKTGPWIYKNSEGKVKEKELYKNGVLATKIETEAFFNKNKAADEKPKTTNTLTVTPKSKDKKTNSATLKK